MKNINKLALILSLLLLTVLFSAISIIALPKAFRYTWVAMNPWNGVEGVMLTIQRFLHTGPTWTYIISGCLILLIWWRLYALINRWLP